MSNALRAGFTKVLGLPSVGLLLGLLLQELRKLSVDVAGSADDAERQTGQGECRKGVHHHVDQPPEAEPGQEDRRSYRSEAKQRREVWAVLMFHDHLPQRAYGAPAAIAQRHSSQSRDSMPGKAHERCRWAGLLDSSLGPRPGGTNQTLSHGWAAPRNPHTLA